MAFAIFYNMQDLTPIAAHMDDVNLKKFLTAQEMGVARALWNGGLKDWSIAPNAYAIYPEHCDGDTDTRILVLSGNGVTKAAMIATLVAIGTKVPGARYMLSIARDLEGWSGCVEPWPEV